MREMEAKEHVGLCRYLGGNKICNKKDPGFIQHFFVAVEPQTCQHCSFKQARRKSQRYTALNQRENTYKSLHLDHEISIKKKIKQYVHNGFRKYSDPLLHTLLSCKFDFELI